MNDPATQPIDVEEQRNWLIDFRQSASLSWSEVSKRINVPTGTLSQFGSEKGYAGDEGKIAQKVYQYRQLIAAQAALDSETPEAPGFFETQTSTQLGHVLAMAQRGRIVVAALGPGLGKTMTARHYQACFPNVFLCTMTPSTAGVNNMQIEVLEAMGEREPAGTPQKLTRRIRERVRNMRNPLLILDEAQHLSEKALEEIRSWNDSEGLGIALFGNESVLQRLEGGNRRAAFAQLFSRVSLRVVRSHPLRADIDALAHAWKIFDDQAAAYLQKICMTPGGLRSGSMALELGWMLAASEGQPLGLGHLQDAWAQLSNSKVLA